jgi:hypothetical protein
LLYVHVPAEAIHIIPQSHPVTIRETRDPLVNPGLTALKEEIA